MLRECKFMLPRSFVREHGQRIAIMLAGKFGGYTRFDTDGGWVDNEGNLHVDEMVTFIVAVDPGPAHPLPAPVVLRVLAKRWAREAGEKAVYFVGPDGAVTIYDIEKAPA